MPVERRKRRITHTTDSSRVARNSASPMPNAWEFSTSVIDAMKGDALAMMKEHSIGGIPVVNEREELVGIVTNRDLRFENRFDLPISEVMTKENLITVSVGTTLEEAETILHKHRVEKLLVVR